MIFIRFAPPLKVGYFAQSKPKRMTLKDIPNLYQLIDQALAEDIGDGDHSALACIPADAIGKAQLRVKENGIIAGVSLAEIIFKRIDPRFEINVLVQDGAHVQTGDIAFVVEGPSQKMLSAERLVLNFMQRLSAIATQTNTYVQRISGTKAKVLDTRKTTPGLRYLEKWAVALGGGSNHRIGLFDMIMLKDNHIDFAGGIAPAINKTKQYLREKGKNLDIEIETRNMSEVEEVLRVGGVNRIMLDNFTLEETREAVLLINGRYETESSGGITLDTIRGYAECGVDYISVGALTHSVRSMDLSLKAV
jgi:nicotinate-nucleotide pyrophosphorylase (carboxylating)